MNSKVDGRIATAREGKVTCERMRRPEPITAIATRVMSMVPERSRIWIWPPCSGLACESCTNRSVINFGDSRCRSIANCRIGTIVAQLCTSTRLAFFHGGAIALAGIVCGRAPFQMGVDVAHALRNYRRASSRKQRCTKRGEDPAELERYQQGQRAPM